MLLCRKKKRALYRIVGARKYIDAFEKYHPTATYPQSVARIKYINNDHGYPESTG
jgi:hypothetical protein